MVFDGLSFKDYLASEDGEMPIILAQNAPMSSISINKYAFIAITFL